MEGQYRLVKEMYGRLKWFAVGEGTLHIIQKQLKSAISILNEFVRPYINR